METFVCFYCVHITSVILQRLSAATLQMAAFIRGRSNHSALCQQIELFVFY